MPKARKHAALIAALMVPLALADVSAALAAPIQIHNFTLAPTAGSTAPTSTPSTSPGDAFRPIDITIETGGGNGAFKPMIIDGSREEARVDVGEIDQGSSDSDEERSGLQTRQFEMQAALSCRISGDDLIIANKGAEPIAAGTTIKWQVKGGAQKGYLAMQSDVDPGKGFRAKGVFEGGADGERCSARGV